MVVPSIIHNRIENGKAFFKNAPDISQRWYSNWKS